MKITFLGTGTSQGIPVIGCNCNVCLSVDFRDQRLRTSVLIEESGNVFVIDTGPDFRQQILRNRVKKLDAVIFTHQHKDHTAGLDDVRAFNFIQGTYIPAYARKTVLDQLRREFAYVFADEKYPGIPKIELHEIDNKPFAIKETTFIPIEVLHHKLPVFGFRIGDFTYITDANYIDPKELEKIKGSRIIVLNALQKEDHISHFSLEEAVALFNELKPEKGYITHIGHRMGTHTSATKDLPDFVHLAHDGLTISI